MGFPGWTLWGMGISAAAALFFVLLAYLAQSPRQIARYRWLSFRLVNRGRALTGYGLASLLVALGFFLAGIPIEPPTAQNQPQTESAVLITTPIPTLNPIESVEEDDSDGSEALGSTENEAPLADETPESGAFLRPPTAAPEDAATGDDNPPAAVSEEESDETPEPPPPAVTPSPSPVPTVTPTSTPSVTPTMTPTPTMTATPITGPTAIVDTLSSTLWVRRTPGGAQLELVLNGDILILEDSQLSAGGTLWQQVRTPSGNLGWVQAEFLTFSEN